MDITDSISEDLEGSEKHGTENVYHLRKYLNNQEQTIGRDTNVKGFTRKGSDGNEQHVFGNRRKGNPYCIVTENLAEL